MNKTILAACAMALVLASPARADTYTVDNSIDDGPPCCDLTGGTGSFAGQPVGSFTQDGGSLQKTDTQYEAENVTEAIATVQGAATGAVVGLWIGNVPGMVLGVFGGYFGPLVWGELEHWINSPGAPVYSVETAEERTRREIMQNLVEGVIGKVKWDDNFTTLNTGATVQMSGRSFKVADGFKAVGKLARYGGSVSADARAILNDPALRSSKRRKVAGIFVNTTAAIGISHVATPVSKLAAGALLNISKGYTPSRDQKLALGLVLTGTSANNRRDIISMVAGTNTNSPERNRVNKAVIECMTDYKEARETAF